jgi:hypothetical protein
MEEKSDDVKIGEGATCADRLSRDILYGLAGIESDNFIFSSVQALD